VRLAGGSLKRTLLHRRSAGVAPFGQAARARHFCRRAGLVDEDQPVRLTPHGRLSIEHRIARLFQQSRAKFGKTGCGSERRKIPFGCSGTVPPLTP